MGNKSGSRFSTFIFGSLAGFIAGLAYAPRPGSETRELWKEKKGDLQGKADDLKTKAQELLDKVEGAWESSEEWREQAFERAVEFKMKGEDIGKKAVSEAEHLSDELKTRLTDLSSKVKGIQTEIDDVAEDTGEGAGSSAGAALSALKERLQDAKDTFKDAMKAKETELKKRVDEAAEPKEEEADAGEPVAKTSSKKAASKKTAAKKDSDEA